MYRLVCTLICSFTISYSAFCQFEELKKALLIQDSFSNANPLEKIFIHYDRNYYSLDDTIWLKGYIVEAKYNSLLDSSKLVYIEVYNDSSQLINRSSIYCSFGLFQTSINLDRNDYKQGQYILRAYTKQMENYGDSLFFIGSFRIIDSESDVWKREQSGISPIKKANQISDTKISGRSYNPVNIGLNFYPEGGILLVNKDQQLGIKAVDRNGNGVPVEGYIRNRHNKIISTFSTYQDGRGTTLFRPDNVEQYYAELKDGSIFPLPLPKSTGIILRVVNTTFSDSLEIIVDASTDYVNNAYFLRASVRGISCLMGTIFLEKIPYKLRISKKEFPSGVCKFTLYDSSLHPISEKVTFIFNQDNIKLELSAQKKIFNTRDTVNILLKAKDTSNNPIIGNFSVSVINTDQIISSKYSENIISYLLLTSDLNGTIEEPYHYFSSNANNAIDALILTLGHVNYNFIFTKHRIDYEKEFTISGKVLNILNKPVVNTHVFLFGKDGKTTTFLKDTVTDLNGTFEFVEFPYFKTDSVEILIRALNKRQGSFGVSVSIDLPDFPKYHHKKTHSSGQDIIHDSAAYNYVRKRVQLKNEYGMQKEYLPEVIVTSRVKIPGSKNLNPFGSFDRVITKRKMDKSPKITLRDVLRKNIKELRIAQLGSKVPLFVYKFNNAIVVFLIDGYNINKDYTPLSDSNMEFINYIDSYLNYLNAEDLIGIEIMSSKKNTFAYEKYHNYIYSDKIDYVFIEITTYSGNGAYYKKSPSYYLYKPLTPKMSQQYSIPTYEVYDLKNSSFNSTIYWNPNVLTDERGLAELSFLLPNYEGKFKIIVQGVGLNGGLGYAEVDIISKGSEALNKSTIK